MRKLTLIIVLVCFGLTLHAESGETNNIIVVIDAGHGGRDPGNLHFEEGMKDEKDLNLIIANKVGDYIQQYTNNITVVYTRTSDEYVSLNERVRIANSGKAHYFISIHCNASTNRAVIGTESHIHNNNARTSRQLAMSIERDFKLRAKRRSRGVKTKDDRTHNLQVLWQTNMPGVLIECGFMSNQGEESYLNSDKGQNLLASAIFRGFRDFVNKEHPFTIYTKPLEETVAPADSAVVDSAAVDTMVAPPVVAETIYRVQVLATIEPAPEDAIEFKRLKDFEVDLVEATDGRAFKYRYFVGRFTSKKDAKEAQKQVREAGIKDAFVVSFTH